MTEREEAKPEREKAKPVSVDWGAILNTLRRPRVMFILLGVWASIGALTEIFSSTPLFLDLQGRELQGALGGRALSAEAIPLAVLYLYCARDPERYQRVFWLALIEQIVAIVANIYHLGAGDFGLESVILPVAVAGGFVFLLFPNLFGSRPAAVELPTEAAQ